MNRNICRDYNCLPLLYNKLFLFDGSWVSFKPISGINLFLRFLKKSTQAANGDHDNKTINFSDQSDSNTRDRKRTAASHARDTLIPTCMLWEIISHQYARAFAGPKLSQCLEEDWFLSAWSMHFCQDRQKEVTERTAGGPSDDQGDRLIRIWQGIFSAFLPWLSVMKMYECNTL